MILALSDLPEDIRLIAESRLEQIARLPRVARVMVYGSYAKGTQTSESDLDIAVFFDAESSDLLEAYRTLVRICLCPEIDIQVQAFCADELLEPSGIIDEIIHGGFEYRIRH